MWNAGCRGRIEEGEASSGRQAWQASGAVSRVGQCATMVEGGEPWRVSIADEAEGY